MVCWCMCSCCAVRVHHHRSAHPLPPILFVRSKRSISTTSPSFFLSTYLRLPLTTVPVHVFFHVFQPPSSETLVLPPHPIQRPKQLLNLPQLHQQAITLSQQPTFLAIPLHCLRARERHTRAFAGSRAGFQGERGGVCAVRVVEVDLLAHFDLCVDLEKS